MQVSSAALITGSRMMVSTDMIIGCVKIIVLSWGPYHNAAPILKLPKHKGSHFDTLPPSKYTVLNIVLMKPYRSCGAVAGDYLGTPTGVRSLIPH